MDTRARPLMQTHLHKKQKKKTNKQKQEDEQQRRTKDASIRQWKAKKVKSSFKTGSFQRRRLWKKTERPRRFGRSSPALR